MKDIISYANRQIHKKKKKKGHITASVNKCPIFPQLLHSPSGSILYDKVKQDLYLDTVAGGSPSGELKSSALPFPLLLLPFDLV